MYMKPSSLSKVKLPDDVLKADKKGCKHYGPCGVGQQALYLNSTFLDRRFYVPITQVKRAYKRIAMSKGGFSGKGVFGAIPYLVVEYDGGQTVQCTFKFEQNVDMMLAEIQKRWPKIKTISEAAAKRLEEARREEEARYLKTLTPEAQSAVDQLTQAKDYLEQRQDLSTGLASASKALRVYRATNPAYRWAALAFAALAVLATVYGLQSLLSHSGDYGLYIMVFGMAALFLFASTNVLPTSRNNKKALESSLESARDDMRAYLKGYVDFPVPVHYAHPATLTRMIRVIREGKAQSTEEAYQMMMGELKAMNHSVQVNEVEYNEIITIKPMFLLENYQ